MKTYSWHTGETYWPGFGYKVEDGEPWEYDPHFRPCRKGRWYTRNHKKLKGLEIL